ncbi:MAG: pilus assembly protein TadG-related protein [Candidatus Binataceae bacterium]
MRRIRKIFALIRLGGRADGFAKRAKAFLREAESGQVAMMTAAGILVLMGSIGMAVDFGYLEHQKEQMQTAADAAAIAGATELNQSDMVGTAQHDAALNGFTNGQNGITVSVNNPPQSGAYAGKAQYVEAIVSGSQSTFFLRALGIDSFDLSARAVARQGASPCIYVLDPSASGAMLANGNVEIQSACGIFVDSSSSSGLLANGNVSISAPQIGVVGGYLANGNVELNPTPATGISPASDPLSYVSAPSGGDCDYTNLSANGNSVLTLNPGVYCGGISINGNSSVTFNPGAYIIAGGGMTVNGDASLSGDGVTFYDTSGTSSFMGITINGDIQANLSAPTSGPLEGILFFQDRSVVNGPGSTINGNAKTTFDGAFYFPTTQLTYNGNSSTNGYTIVVADKLLLNGNSSLGDNYQMLADGSPIRADTAVLSE